MVLCALIGSRPKLTKILFSLLILTAYGCGTAPQSPVDSDPNDFSDEFVLSGEGGETLRTIHLSLAPGKTKRYRITTEQFTAKLTQTSQALAKLSAQHYSNRIDGEPSMTPEIEVVAQDEYKVRNWTFRVHNLGEEPLEATIVVAVLPLNTEETPHSPNTEEASEVVETLRTIHLSLAPGNPTENAVLGVHSKSPSQAIFQPTMAWASNLRWKVASPKACAWTRDRLVYSWRSCSLVKPMAP